MANLFIQVLLQGTMLVLEGAKLFLAKGNSILVGAAPFLAAGSQGRRGKWH